MHEEDSRIAMLRKSPLSCHEVAWKCCMSAIVRYYTCGLSPSLRVIWSVRPSPMSTVVIKIMGFSPVPLLL